MSNKQLNIFVAITFVLGLMFYLVAILEMPFRFTFDLNRFVGSVHASFVAQAIGNVLMFVGLLASINRKK
jgi:hypothetical protein